MKKYFIILSIFTGFSFSMKRYLDNNYNYNDFGGKRLKEQTCAHLPIPIYNRNSVKRNYDNMLGSWENYNCNEFQCKKNRLYDICHTMIPTGIEIIDVSPYQYIPNNFINSCTDMVVYHGSYPHYPFENNNYSSNQTGEEMEEEDYQSTGYMFYPASYYNMEEVD